MVVAATRAEQFDALRPLLFGIAYRMLGSVQDAEDIVQDAYLRWEAAPETAIASPKAYLSTIVTRLCLDHLRSARVQREQYVGPWLPEPLVSERAPDVAEASELRESVSLAFLVLLERLTPLERAVFLLHEVFGYEHREIAAMVGRSEAHCRQLARRARRALDGVSRPTADGTGAVPAAGSGGVAGPGPEHGAAAGRPLATALDEPERLTREFLRAVTAGDLPALVATLAEDITLWTDGGGKVRAALQPIHGADRAARFLLGIMAKLPAALTLRAAWVNGTPGVVAYQDGVPVGVLALEVAAGRICALRIIVNPDKLRRVPPAATLRAAARLGDR